MNYGLIFRTVRHLKPTQVYHQIKYRVIKPKYVAVEAPNIDSSFRIQVSGLKTEPIPKYKCLEGNKFTFLNLEHEFAGWNFTGNGMLWAYNQNYFDWINQEKITKEESCKWIDRFIEDLPSNKVGLDPYPIALRSINWIKFFLRYPEIATKPRVDSLYSQVKLLEKKLEYHLLANHLLEDVYALYISTAYFQDERLQKKATKLLLGQLKEQILPDGAHYEQSVMYHCILLDRLLDCINIGERCGVNGAELRKYAQRMVGWLKSMCYSDGTYPLFNDAATGIAPEPKDIIDYAKRLNVESDPAELKECGYRKMANAYVEAFVDVGNITASYQPGHTHADTFNYELRIDGKPIVVDTGISTYEKNERRQYERSSMAHNCVVVDGKSSYEVWDGFRVGKRCEVKRKKQEAGTIVAEHNGFEKLCTRAFSIDDKGFTVEDWYDGSAISYVHLAEGVDREVVKVEGADSLETKECQYSTEYNKFHKGTVLEIHFRGHLKTRIKL